MPELISRVFISLFLAHSVLLAHLIGGGIPEPTIQLALLSGLAFLSIRAEDYEGPKLALFLLAFQTLGHSTMSGNTNDSRMQVAHIAAAVLSYFLIKNFNNIAESIRNFLAPKFSAFSIARYIKYSAHSYSNTWYSNQFFLSCISDRGPPQACGNW